MIRVLHFAHIINRFDVVDTVLTRLDRSKFEVSALTGLPPKRDGAVSGEEAYRNKLLGFDFTRRNYPRMLSELVKEIRQFRPQILHAHHYDESIVASIAVKVARVPCYVMWRHYSDHIYFLTKGVKQRVYLAGEAWCNNNADFITVPTQDVASILTDRQGVAAEKVKVLPFGVDFNRYHPSSADAPARIRREYGLEGKYMMLACCRLNPEKGLEYLLQALPQVRAQGDGFKLMIVGEGPHRSKLEALCRDLAIERLVEFAGRRTDALDWFAAADLVVQPSFCESFCQVLIEALAVAKPVIMTPVGVAPEVIGENERGRLVQMGNSDLIAEKILELMNDRELGDRLGRKGQEFIKQNLAAEVAARRYEAFYEEALDSVS